MAILYVSWDKQNPITYAWEIEGDDPRILYSHGPGTYPFVIPKMLFTSEEIKIEEDIWRKSKSLQRMNLFCHGSFKRRYDGSFEKIAQNNIWCFLKSAIVELVKTTYDKYSEGIPDNFNKMDGRIFELISDKLSFEDNNRWEITARSNPTNSCFDLYYELLKNFIACCPQTAYHFHFIFERPDFVQKAVSTRTAADKEKALFWASTLVTLHNTINLYRYLLYTSYKELFDSQGSGPITLRLQKRLVEVLQQDIIPPTAYDGLEKMNMESNVGNWKYFNVGFRNCYKKNHNRDTNIIGFEYRTPVIGKDGFREFFDSVMQGELKILQEFDFSNSSQVGTWGMKRLKEKLIPVLSKTIKEYLDKFKNQGEIMIKTEVLTEYMKTSLDPVFFCDIDEKNLEYFFLAFSTVRKFRELFSITNIQENELQEQAVAKAIMEDNKKISYLLLCEFIKKDLDTYKTQYKSDLNTFYKRDPFSWLTVLNGLHLDCSKPYVDEYDYIVMYIKAAVKAFYSDYAHGLPYATEVEWGNVQLSSEDLATENLIYRISLPYLKHIRYHPGINNQKRAKDAFDNYHNSLYKYFANKPNYNDGSEKKKFRGTIERALKIWVTESGIIDALKITDGIQKHYYWDGTQVGGV